MTTNKTEVFRFHCHGRSAPAYSCNKPADNSGEYVRLAEYEALKAECEKLKAGEASVRDALGGYDNHAEPAHEIVKSIRHRHDSYVDTICDLKARMAVLAAPAVQGEQNQELVPAGKPDRITEQDVRDIATSYCHWKSVGFYNTWFSEKGRELLNKLNADREQVPTVAVLVEALDCILSMDDKINIVDVMDPKAREMVEIARDALAAHRKQPEGEA